MSSCVLPDFHMHDNGGTVVVFFVYAASRMERQGVLKGFMMDGTAKKCEKFRTSVLTCDG